MNKRWLWSRSAPGAPPAKQLKKILFLLNGGLEIERFSSGRHCGISKGRKKNIRDYQLSSFRKHFPCSCALSSMPSCAQTFFMLTHEDVQSQRQHIFGILFLNAIFMFPLKEWFRFFEVEFYLEVVDWPPVLRNWDQYLQGAKL